MVFNRGQYGPQIFSGRTFDKATVATTLNFTKLKNRWLMGLRADARRACVGFIDRSVGRTPAPKPHPADPALAAPLAADRSLSVASLSRDILVKCRP